LIKHLSGNFVFKISRSAFFAAERLVLVRDRPIKYVYQHQN